MIRRHLAVPFLFMLGLLGLWAIETANAQQTPASTNFNDSAVGVFIPQTGNTNVMTINTAPVRRLFVICTVAGQALDAFNVLAYPKNAPTTQATLATISTDYTAPVAPMIRASASLVTLGAGSTGWFIVDTGGLDNILVQASSGNAAGSTISCWSSAQ